MIKHILVLLNFYRETFFFFNCKFFLIYTNVFVGNRIEDFFYEKIDKKKPNRLSNTEYVGIDMIEAGNDFGPGIAYGMLHPC